MLGPLLTKKSLIRNQTLIHFLKENMAGQTFLVLFLSLYPGVICQSSGIRTRQIYVRVLLSHDQVLEFVVANFDHTVLNIKGKIDCGGLCAANRGGRYEGAYLI